MATSPVPNGNGDEAGRTGTRGEEEEASMHLTFAYGSAVTRFSDRRIRVRVVPDQEQAGRADGEAAPAAEQASEQGAHGRAATSDAAQQHGLDLEMQPIPEADSQNGAAGYELPVSSLILAASSHYFRRMLDSSDWQESSSKERPIEVTLCQEEAAVFPHLIEFMYRRDLPAAVQDAEPLCWLLQLADRFETPSCVTQCVTRLLSTPLTLLDAALYVALPQPLKARPALRRLMDAVCALTGWSYDAVTRADSVATLSFPCMVQLAHALRGQDEHAEALLQLLLEWLRADATARWAGFGFLLLPLLDFSAMSPAFLREVEQCPELSSPEGRALLEYARKRAAPPDAVDVQVDVQDPAAQAPAGAPAPVAPVRPARGSGGALGIGIFLLAVILFLILTLAPGPKAGKKH